MSYAERFYESDETYNNRADDIQALFENDSNLLRWELVDEAWQKFLEANENSLHIPARAHAAIQHVERITDDLTARGLAQPEQSEVGLLPTLSTEFVGYIAHGELLNYYKKTSQSAVSIEVQLDAYIEAQRKIRAITTDFLKLYTPADIERAYLGLADVIDYSTIIVLGPAGDRRERSVRYRIARSMPSLDARNALGERGWAYSHPLRPTS